MAPGIHVQRMANNVKLLEAYRGSGYNLKLMIFYDLKWCSGYKLMLRLVTFVFIYTYINIGKENHNMQILT